MHLFNISSKKIHQGIKYCVLTLSCSSDGYIVGTVGRSKRIVSTTASSKCCNSNMS